MCSASPHILTLWTPPPLAQDAIDRGWLLDFRSCVRGKPRMSVLLDVALGIARGIEYMHSKVWRGGDVEWVWGGC